jgi:hypothetical protein
MNEGRQHRNPRHARRPVFALASTELLVIGACAISMLIVQMAASDGRAPTP